MNINYSEIAKKYGATVYFAIGRDIDDNGIENYLYKSFVTNNKITIGTFYNEAELRELSFWHELGHVFVQKRKPKYKHYDKWLDGKWPILDEMLRPDEPLAWRYGLMLARRHGRSFSTNARWWAVDCLQTYMRNSGDRFNMYGTMCEERKKAILRLSRILVFR